MRPVFVLIKCQLGKTYEVADALGDPENPLGHDAIVAKARTLMTEAGLSRSAIDAVVKHSLTLGQATTLRPFTDALP